MDTPSVDDPIDEIRRLFEMAIALDAERRETWLIENVANTATRHVVRRLLQADARPGVLDISVMQMLDAIYLPSVHATSAKRPP